MSNIYRTLQDNGYHTMVTGKDDLSKTSGVGLDGSINAAELGFSAWSRTLGKPTALNGESPKDPYGVALQAAGLYTQGHQCYIGDDKVPQCCEEVKKPTGKGKVAENCNVPDLITNQVILLSFAFAAVDTYVLLYLFADTCVYVWSQTDCLCPEPLL